MSITPVDKPPDGEEGQGKPENFRSTAIRNCVGRFVSWIAEHLPSEWFTVSDHTSGRHGPFPGKDDDDTPNPCAVKASGCPTFPDFPERDQPLTYPGRELQGINTPDVVGIQTDEGLRLSIPENPDASLTSDVWTSVEP